MSLNAIEVQCYTNLDGYAKCEWPTVMVAIPHIGDWVEAADGKRLRVCSVTHKMDKPVRFAGLPYSPKNAPLLRVVQPLLRVELSR